MRIIIAGGINSDELLERKVVMSDNPMGDIWIKSDLGEEKHYNPNNVYLTTVIANSLIHRKELAACWRWLQEVNKAYACGRITVDKYLKLLDRIDAKVREL